MGKAQTWDALLATYIAEESAVKPTWGRGCVWPRRPLLASQRGGRVPPRAVPYARAQ